MVATTEVIEAVVTTFRAATAANGASSARRGNVVELDGSNARDVMVTADLHGHRLNYERLLEIASLDASRARHLVMQEVCHGGPCYPLGGGCMSHLLLEDVAALKVRFPERFHFLLSNHEWAEIADFPIYKANRLLNLEFRLGLQQMYGAMADKVRDAATEFLRSCPLAIRVGETTWITHSAPEDVRHAGFDVSLLERDLSPSDFAPHGELFRFLWGRDYSPANAAAFAEMLQACLLIHGHEPCRGGHHVPNDRQIILDCCGSTVGYLLLPATAGLTQESALACLRTLEGDPT